ncbi:hypothetical protein ASPNIDRAFT_171671, partial [Aspergillus niger ATCC 1015]
MSTTRLPNVPALRKQQLLLEFASLQHAAPPGTYMSLSPGDPTLWLGVIFVRSGPYASAVLRFQIRFPTSYPDMPPLVNFATDVFHPLIVPLTTYTFSTGASSEDPVSATDEERLPPGGFSLRHGFPHWFGRAKRAGLQSATPPRETASVRNSSATSEGDEGEAVAPSPAEKSVEPRKTVPVSELLDYIRSTFDDETVLDSLPLEAAGNPSAWHAWKAHRKGSTASATKKGSPQARSPGDWHWDGIWARRVQNEIEASSSDAMLYG